MSERVSFSGGSQICIPHSAFRILSCSGLIVLLLSSSAWGQGSAEAVSSPGVLRLGMTASMFTGVNMLDAKAALEVWGDALAKSMVEGQKVEWVVFPDRPSMLHAVRTGQVHLVSMTSLDYLEVRDDALVEPSLVGLQWGGRVGLQYLLLVRRDGDVQNLRELQGKNVVIGTRDEGRMVRMWLDILLLQDGLAESSNYLSAEKVDKAMKALLQVFFGQVDACIVTAEAYLTAVELNPQIVESLKILDRSPDLLSRLMCFPKDCDVGIQRILLDSALKLHMEATGEQILALFHLERCDLFRPSYLENVTALVEEHRRLGNGYADVE